ncbi:hypothetical protein LINGRAHAP2_LOCUS31650 [Linum grandiflorum]
MHRAFEELVVFLVRRVCLSDVLDYLDKFLVLGFEIEFDGDGDDYFSKCSTSKSSNGVCGFNSSDPDKAFLCFKSTARISPWIGDSDTNRIAILCSVFTALCLVLVVLVLVAVFRSRQLKSVVAEEDPGDVPAPAPVFQLAPAGVYLRGA